MTRLREIQLRDIENGSILVYYGEDFSKEVERWFDTRVEALQFLMVHIAEEVNQLTEDEDVDK